MNAFNIVRVRVKPGHDQAFIEAHRRADTAFKGWLRGALVKTGERAYCIVGEWDSMASLAAARPQMLAVLDTFRADLEDLGQGLGVSDPVSGEVVLNLQPWAPRRPSRLQAIARRQNLPASQRAD